MRVKEEEEVEKVLKILKLFPSEGKSVLYDKYRQ